MNEKTVPSDTGISDRAPLPCPEMGDIRAEIDRIDARLVQLLRDRLDMIEAAAKVKPQRNQVRDDARIDEVLALVRAEADKHNLPADMAAKLWTMLIEMSIAHELEKFDNR